MDQVPDTAQHFIECDTESCRDFSAFYCNTCYQKICCQCEQFHLDQNNGHDIVHYHEKKRKLPLEKCMIHPTNDINVHCDVCQDPLCYMCFAQHHSDHDFSDLESIYNDILQQCQKEVTHIWEREIPRARDYAALLEKKKENVKKEIAKFRVSMKERADELKSAIDSTLIDKNKELTEIENSMISDTVEQLKETKEYINYLEKLITDCESKMFSIKPTELMDLHKDISLATLKRPSETEPKLQLFTLCTLNKEEIVKQLEIGKKDVDSSEKLFDPSSVKKIHEVPTAAYRIYHLSPSPPDKFWVIDGFGNLTQSDMKGKILSRGISTSLWYMYIIGNHTVTREGKLLYTDYGKNSVYRVTGEKTINKLIDTWTWGPGAIYSSPINGHLLVGMELNSDWKITRYNSEGRKLLEIQHVQEDKKVQTLYQRDDKRQTLYQSVYFITENMNGDICVSDFKAKKVVGVTRSGHFKFSYSGHDPQFEFCPYGVCTDVLGHILVCSSYYRLDKSYSSVHLLDSNGEFITLLLEPENCPLLSCALCIDDKHNFLVGGRDSSSVYVYKYLQNMEK